ncbi:MAG: hypothetical protein IAF38_05245, partial [Bacteroidia bacterium]|nr:hypothetical protein [Bacteroidia bacterium]
MKKLLLLLFISATGTEIFAQQLPNNGFETWIPSSNSTERPDQWHHLNEILPSALALFVPATWAKISPGYNGSSYCVKMKTVNATGQPANGILTTGSIDYQNQTITGGLAYTLKPDSLTGYYKYTPAGTDKGTIEIVLKDANNIDTIAQAKFYTPNATVATWTRFSAPLIYRN